MSFDFYSVCLKFSAIFEMLRNAYSKSGHKVKKYPYEKKNEKASHIHFLTENTMGKGRKKEFFFGFHISLA